MPLDSLPLEILQHIASHLESSDKSTLYSLVLVNKACHSAASQLRFRRIVFPIISRRWLARDVPRWEALLRDNDAFGSVRRLSVVGGLPRIDAEDSTFCGLARYGVDDEVDELGYAGEALFKLRTGFKGGFGDKEEKDRMLEPLAELIRRCTGLRDVYWSHDVQFAPCLLRVLREALPLCRLHVTAFELDSLAVDLERPAQDVDTHEYALATFRNLSSVTVPFTVYNGGSKAEYSREAVLQMVKEGLAPNLKEVHLIEMRDEEQPPDRYVEDKRRPPWRGIFVDRDQNEPSDAPSKLGRLEIFTLEPACIENFRPWASSPLFANLRSLHLRQVDAETLAQASRLKFPSLKSLVIGLKVDFGPDRGDQEDDECKTIDSAAATFLESLPSLESVHISGLFARDALWAALVHHSKTLHTLSITPHEPTVPGWRITPDTIRLISLQCPNIRDLRLRIPRTMGDSREVAIYKAIGRLLPHLTRLSLELDCFAAWGFNPEQSSDDLSDDERASPEERAALDRKRTRDILLSAAVDETLTRAIFNTIREAHPSSSCSSPLVRLKITPFLEYFLRALPDLEPVVFSMMREWVCVRDPTATAPGSREEMLAQRLVVQEMNPVARRNLLAMYCDPEVRDIRLGGCKDVFRELWPAREEYVDEETGRIEIDWHSFPLEIE